MSPQPTEALMTLAELARFLHLGQKTVLQLARDKKIPAVQIEKEWRFRKDDINQWLENQLHGDDEGELAQVTDGMRVPLGDVMGDKGIVHDMRSRDALGAIEELAARAYSNNWLNDKPWFVGALVEREALASTAMDGGVAFLHARARDTERISRPFVIVGRSYDGIDFGAPDGEKTFLFFLLGLKYDKLHLPILGRLARIMLRDPTTIARLRATTSPTKMRDILQRLDAREMEGGPLPVVNTVAKPVAAAPVLDKDLRLRAIMRAQARRKHEEKKQEVEEAKAAAKREKEEAAAKRREETAERRRVAAEKRKEAARIKKEAAAAKREREREKKRAAAAKKK